MHLVPESAPQSLGWNGTHYLGLCFDSADGIVFVLAKYKHKQDQCHSVRRLKTQL